jgi:hypothetical protein
VGGEDGADGRVGAEAAGFLEVQEHALEKAEEGVDVVVGDRGRGSGSRGGEGGGWSEVEVNRRPHLMVGLRSPAHVGASELAKKTVGLAERVVISGVERGFGERVVPVA